MIKMAMNEEPNTTNDCRMHAYTEAGTDVQTQHIM